MGRSQRLTLMEREALSRMLAVGASLRATARHVGRPPSTRARELARHRLAPPASRAVPAYQRAQGLAPQARKPRTLAGQPRWWAAVLRVLAPRWASTSLPTACASALLMSRRGAARPKPSIPSCLDCPAMR